FMADVIKPGQDLFLSGKASIAYDGVQLKVSEYEIIEKNSFPREIMPVYCLTEGLSQKSMRTLVLNCLREYLSYYPEIIEEEVRNKLKLCSIDYAFKKIHFPDNMESWHKARNRLALEELLLFQIQMKMKSNGWEVNNYTIHQEKSNLVGKITANLPFKLTPAQQKVIRDIFLDMEKPAQMNRLLQGDVGSGKTVVAALAIAKAVASGFQSALMAPTEILAEQHYNVIKKLYSHVDLQVALLTGTVGGSERRLILEKAKKGEIDVLIGTHALIQEGVEFARLGLVVIDEQHRFGVRQRAALSHKSIAPDILVMTATPIPRTLALTLYGDLSLSVIDQLPPGRKAIKTYFVKPEMRKKVYQFVSKHVASGTQAYVVCPLIEESEKQDLQAAVSLYKELTSILTDINVGLIHSRLKPAQKEMVMRMFNQGEIKVLVSTSVIEVGVDVPNASIMVIEQAERFGLSQLHQLRGRVGRGRQQSYCFLIANPKSPEALARLQVMERTNDGFELAEEDLLLRGPGEFWGVRQHGLDGLKVANLTKDKKLIEISRLLAEKYLDCKISPALAKYINIKFPQSNLVIPN
ncbi:MAG: ATP-dependent DNA helicase RecG, partial [Thermoanaerobacteraceae bacterium]|nr:ATP-dependent DNA helicase RecG [Thermoanaerobacteraceae bacterium]